LTLFSLLPDFSAYPIFTYVLYIIVDLMSANALMKIAETGEAGSSRLFKSPRREKRWRSIEIGAL
jgi:phosphatidylinositol glycan class U